MKKQFLAIMLAVCMLLPCLSAGAWASETDAAAVSAPIKISTTVDGVEIYAQSVKDGLYLFLPRTVDLTNLSLRFHKTDENIVSTEIVNVPSLLDKDSQGRYSLKKTMRGVTVRFYIMQGSSIPTMYLTSSDTAQGRTWVDKSKKNETTGSMKLISADGVAIYDDGLTQIKARGNSTFGYPKKPYQIKLSNKADLLGTGEKVKTWVLLANYADATLMHDKLFKDLAAELGMPYVASCGWVNLYYDGEYRGVYLLSEKNSVGSTGVDIADMEEAYKAVNSNYGDDMLIAEGQNIYGQKYLYTENLNELENNAGGWLIELHLQEIDEPNGFFTEQGCAVNVRSPEFAGKTAMEYISEYYQAFERAIYATDAVGNYTGVNAETGKSFDEYVDKESLVQVFLLQELARNPDGFRSSLYFYKEPNSILYAGPIWDQDLTLGTGWTIRTKPQYFDYHYLEKEMLQIPEFYDVMVEYFYGKFLPAAEKWIGNNGTIGKHADLLYDSAIMNYILWPYVRIGKTTVEGHLWPADADYTTVIAETETWLLTRIDTLKKAFPQPETSSETERECFVDIKGHWAEDSINYVVENGLFGGTDKGFEPELSMNRAMLVTILYRLAGSPVADPNSFTDVNDTAWYSQAVSWAAANDIVNGYSDGRFGPNDPITREQLATILWRYAKSQAMDVSVGEDTNILSYEDAFDISEYAFAPLQWACGEGIIGGKPGGLLDPQGGATRAQAAAIFERFLKQVK